MYPEEEASRIWDCEPLKSHPPIFFERQPFSIRRTQSSSSCEDGHVIGAMSLREIQSCAGPRTKIFLYSVISKRKKNTEKSGKEARYNRALRESVRERVSVHEYIADRRGRLLLLLLCK